MQDTLTLDIDGMTCASCVMRVERALAKVPGVASATVNLATETARIETARIETGATAAALLPATLAAVEKAGYHARLHDDGRRADASRGDAAPRAAAGADVDATDARGRRIDDPGSIALSGRAVVLICCALALPMVAPMLLAPFGLHLMLPPALQFALATAVQLLGGLRFYRSAWHAVRAGSANMELLVVIGTTSAWLLSLWLWLARDVGAHGLYFESAAVVVTLVLLGKHLEYRAKRRTLVALDGLAALQPDTATRLAAAGEETVAIAALRVGDRIVVRPGERIAADAGIVDGSSSVDESMLTGESMPVARGPGDAVTGGSINGEGRLVAEVTRLGSESTLARIIRLVEDAQAKKPAIQRLVDRVAEVFVPAVLVIAAITLGVWLWRGAGAEAALIHAVAVLVIACPCALGLATPAAIMAGTGAAARAGILIRDPVALEAAHDVKVVAFDKTGTLTVGHPAVQAVEAAPGIAADALLAVAAAVQAGSEHPLAGAVLRHVAGRAAARDAGADGHATAGATLQARAIRAISGAGVEGVVDLPGPVRIVIGSVALMQAEAVDTAPLAALAEARQAAGMTVAWVAIGRAAGADGDAPTTLLGFIAFADTPRPTAAAAIASLHRLGIATAILSGDNPQAARAIGDRLGIDEAIGALLPQGKVDWIAQARASGRAVAMVGDGINDAPALAAADLGIAMGDGTDVAMATAPITLMRGDPLLVAAAIDIGRRTRANLRQNLFWAFAYNAIGIPLAALGWLSPIVAGAAMAASSICVLGNALRLTRWKPALAPRPTVEPELDGPPAATPDQKRMPALTP